MRARRLRAVKSRNLPDGVFGLLFDKATEVGVALVQHPAIKAVAFTGSAGGGQALMRLAASRPEPIPCYAEMGSTNPVFVLPGALRERAADMAKGLQTSFTLGSGQFCTKPGLVFLPDRDADGFVEALRAGVGTLGTHGMLTPTIAERYNSAVAQRREAGTAEWIAGLESAPAGDAANAGAALFSVPLATFAKNHDLEEEVSAPQRSSSTMASRTISGCGATATRPSHSTIHGTEEDLPTLRN